MKEKRLDLGMSFGYHGLVLVYSFGTYFASEPNDASYWFWHKTFVVYFRAGEFRVDEAEIRKLAGSYHNFFWHKLYDVCICEIGARG
jgi:hypothetical protein